jgi:hypothetical protein
MDVMRPPETASFDIGEYIHSALNLAGGSLDIRTKVIISITLFHPTHTTCTSLSFGIINSSPSNVTYNQINEYVNCIESFLLKKLLEKYIPSSDASQLGGYHSMLPLHEYRDRLGEQLNVSPLVTHEYLLFSRTKYHREFCSYPVHRCRHTP